ncbi:rod shape-determining protein RodA [Clostridia bacterium]|nr:rod shape-determining protein RodA [Clostridia bacterium]
MNSIRRFLKESDLLLLGLTITLALLGVLVISSATASYDTATMRFVFIQLAALLLGVIAIYFISLLDYENLADWWKWLYVINVVLLLAVLVFGMGENETGTNRWIRIGKFGFQPSETVKIIFIITLAKHLDQIKDDINYIKNAGLLALHAAVPIVLVMLQPDAGTAISFACIFLVMIFISGIDWRYLAGGFGALVLTSPIFYFFVLHDYQRSRILEFFNQGSAPSGSSYQVLQSKIAIGSGQVLGTGLFSGLQTQLELLPAKHTDFIFGVVGEELGFMGCIVLITLIFGIIYRCGLLAHRADNGLGRLICIGVAALLAFHSIENILMTVGLMPVTGIPLPFVSYGGTSMVTSLIAIGLVNSVASRR